MSKKKKAVAFLNMTPLKPREVAKLLFEAALDELYSCTPVCAPEGATQEAHVDQGRIGGIFSAVGMALGILHVRLTGEGLGVDEATHTLHTQFKAAYEIAWRDDGAAIFRRMRKKKLPCPTAELLIGWPDADLLAAEFMDLCRETAV